MARNYFFNFLTTTLVFLGAASFCLGADGHPKKHVDIVSCKQMLLLLNDTVPEVKKMPEVKVDSSSKSSAIKEVPKSKKQIAPIAVPVKVDIKPIKIIKPKIIKPVIIKVH
jgi:hypothetical protein